MVLIRLIVFKRIILMSTVIINLKDFIVDPEKRIDLVSLPPQEAIDLIKKSYYDKTILKKVSLTQIAQKIDEKTFIRLKIRLISFLSRWFFQADDCTTIFNENINSAGKKAVGHHINDHFEDILDMVEIGPEDFESSKFTTTLNVT